MAKPKLAQDFKEFLRLLNETGVEYLLVGGYAVNYYGYLRGTADIDFWVAPTAENIGRVAEALERFGFHLDAGTAALLMSPDNIFRMGVPPVRIEMLSSASGVEFADCYSRRNLGEVDGVEVSVISLDDLKVNKLASGRGKDIVDVERLGGSGKRRRRPLGS
jgi:predicted nucleotidyltransferase